VQGAPVASSPSGLTRAPVASSPSGVTRAPVASSPSGLTRAPVSSPSGVQGAPGAEPPAGKRRSAEVVQWLYGVRRAMEPFRQYSRLHPLAVEALEKCVVGALELVRAQELQLDVGPNTLHFEGQAVPFAVPGSTARPRDPLATTLFNEGVRRVTLLPSLTEGEARGLFSEWIDAANQPHGGNVASKVWELEPKGLKLLLLDVFDGATEGGDGTGLSAATGRGRGLSLAEQIDSLVSAISAEGLAADGGGGFVSQGLIQVSADDVELLRSEAVRSITAAQLAQQELEGARVSGLDEKAVTSLRTELETERTQGFARLAPALLNAAVLNDVAHWPALTEAYRRFVQGAFGSAAYAVPLHTWQRLVSETKNDPVFGGRRVEVLKRFKAVLLAPEVLAELVGGLEGDGTREPAHEALLVLGKAAVPAVLKFASATRVEAARKKALAFVRDVDPSQMASAAAVDSSGLGSLVTRLPTMADAEARDILEKLLSSLDTQSRRAAAKALTPKRAPLIRHHLLLARLQDNDVEVRLAMLKLVIALEDPSTAQTLFALAKRPRIDSPELELLFDAVSVVAGVDGFAFLVSELNKGEGARKVAAALALGASLEAGAREVLTSTAGKLLTPPALKTACRAALERRSKRGLP
jgi:hypothetical protein